MLTKNSKTVFNTNFTNKSIETDERHNIMFTVLDRSLLFILKF